jgi:hypothetical protein
MAPSFGQLAGSFRLREDDAVLVVSPVVAASWELGSATADGEALDDAEGAAPVVSALSGWSQPVPRSTKNIVPRAKRARFDEARRAASIVAVVAWGMVASYTEGRGVYTVAFRKEPNGPRIEGQFVVLSKTNSLASFPRIADADA